MVHSTNDMADPTIEALEALRERPAWKPGSMMRVMSRVSSGVRSVTESVPRLEQEWHHRAVDAVRGDAPLWVVVGDSTALGVGASTVRHTWVSRLAAALDAVDDHHGVVNLSRSGGMISDVLERQLPVLGLLPRTPSIVTVAVGANDLMRSPAPPVVAGRMRELCEVLPNDSVLATIPAPAASPSARWINRGLCLAAHEHGHRVADLETPLLGIRELAADRIHPSDRGYEAWVGAFADALDIDRALVPPVAAVAA